MFPRGQLSVFVSFAFNSSFVLDWQYRAPLDFPHHQSVVTFRNLKSWHISRNPETRYLVFWFLDAFYTFAHHKLLETAQFYNRMFLIQYTISLQSKYNMQALHVCEWLWQLQIIAACCTSSWNCVGWRKGWRAVVSAPFTMPSSALATALIKAS
jgi:hypothetical protein